MRACSAEGRRSSTHVVFHVDVSSKSDERPQNFISVCSGSLAEQSHFTVISRVGICPEHGRGNLRLWTPFLHKPDVPLFALFEPKHHSQRDSGQARNNRHNRNTASKEIYHCGEEYDVRVIARGCYTVVQSARAPGKARYGGTAAPERRAMDYVSFSYFPRPSPSARAAPRGALRSAHPPRRPRPRPQKGAPSSRGRCTRVHSSHRAQ